LGVSFSLAIFITLVWMIYTIRKTNTCILHSVPGWEDSGVIPDPEISGFSFSMLAVLPIEEQQDGSGREKKRRRD